MDRYSGPDGRDGEHHSVKSEQDRRTSHLSTSTEVVEHADESGTLTSGDPFGLVHDRKDRRGREQQRAESIETFEHGGSFVVGAE